MKWCSQKAFFFWDEKKNLKLSTSLFVSPGGGGGEEKKKKICKMNVPLVHASMYKETSFFFSFDFLRRVGKKRKRKNKNTSKKKSTNSLAQGVLFLFCGNRMDERPGKKK